MARGKKAALRGEFVLFNVVYEDGTQTSNRKVPAEALGGHEGDAAARAIIEAQDRDIAERSGSRRSPIKSVYRADGKEPRYAKAGG
jgi:hypothetical protein